MPTDTTMIVTPHISPGMYVRHRRLALGLTLENVAIMLETAPAVSVQRRVEWLAAIEGDRVAISVPTAWALHITLRLDIGVLAYWMAVAEGGKPSLSDVIFATEFDARAARQPVWAGFDTGTGREA